MKLRYTIGIFYLLVIVLLLNYTTSYAQLKLTDNNTSKFKIIVPSNPSTQEEKAAKILQNYIQQSTGALLSIESEKPTSLLNTIHIGNTKLAKKIVVKRGLVDDGYIIQAKDRSLFIGGKTANSVLNGVYGFLDHFMDTQLLAPGLVHLTKFKSLTIPINTVILKNPAFNIREIFNEISYNDQFTEWYGLTHIYKQPSKFGIYAHTFFRFVPPNEYFKTHPEYYYSKDGKPTQLNLTNEDVKKIIIEKLKVMTATDPLKDLWMVGQEDVGPFPEGDEKTVLISKYGSYSDALVAFINDIAKHFPNKIIATFAYHETLPPPKKIRPSNNVLICYAPIDAYQQSAYAESAETQYARYLKEWGAVTKHLMVWDYPDNYANPYKPYPTLQNLQKNLKFFKDSGVKYVYIESNNKLGGDLKELRTYVAAKLLWNPSLDQSKLISNFCQNYYGAAAPDILNYIKEVCQTALQEKDKLRFFGGSERYLSESHLVKYDRILEHAAISVKNDSDLLQRVNKVRMSIDYLMIEKENNGLFQAKSRQEGLNRADRLKETAAKAGVDNIIINNKPTKIIDIR